MYVSNDCLAMFSVSLNVILRAFSFKMAVTPCPSDLSDLIRILSNNL